MKLTLEHLSARCPNYREIRALSLDCQGLGSASELEKCPQLQFLSLRFNSLLDIAPLARCRNLWVLDLQQNRVGGLEALAALPALGSLGLASNPISLEALQPLRQVQILNLEVSGLEIEQVAGLLPSTVYIELWTLNGDYLWPRDPTSLGRKPIRFYVSPKAQEVLQICDLADEREKELVKMQYLVQDLDYCVELQGLVSCAGMDLSKSRGLKFPAFQLTQWLALDADCKVQISVYIDLYLEGICSEQTFAMVTGGLLKAADMHPKGLLDLRPHLLLGLGLILSANCKGHSLPLSEDQMFTFQDLATNFAAIKSRLCPKTQVQESSAETSFHSNEKIRALCQAGLAIADHIQLNYSSEPRLQRGKPPQAKQLFATMRLFAEPSSLLADTKPTDPALVPDRSYENGRNYSLDRKPPSGKKPKARPAASQRSPDAEPKGPIQVFSAENMRSPQFILCTDAQVLAQPGADWRSLQTAPDMYLIQTNESRVDASDQVPSVIAEKEELLSQFSGASTPIPPRMRESSPGESGEGKKDGTFLTSIGLGPQRPVPRSLSTTTLTSRPSMFVSAGKWRPVASKVLCVVTAPVPVSSYNYYESHKDLLPALPKRKVSRPKMSIVGRQAGARGKVACGSAEEHLTRVFNRDFTPWVPYQLYPRFKARKDQFCVNYGEILVRNKQNLNPRPVTEEPSALVVDSHIRNLSEDAQD